MFNYTIINLSCFVENINCRNLKLHILLYFIQTKIFKLISKIHSDIFLVDGFRFTYCN